MRYFFHFIATWIGTDARRTCPIVSCVSRRVHTLSHIAQIVNRFLCIRNSNSKKKTGENLKFNLQMPKTCNSSFQMEWLSLNAFDTYTKTKKKLPPLNTNGYLKEKYISANKSNEVSLHVKFVQLFFFGLFHNHHNNKSNNNNKINETVDGGVQHMKIKRLVVMHLQLQLHSCQPIHKIIPHIFFIFFFHFYNYHVIFHLHQNNI